MSNSHRVARWLMRFAPTLTSATLVPNSFPEALSRNIAYGVSHGRIGRLASSTPMPGTMTTSWRRTQVAVRTASAPLPSTLSPAASGPGARCSSGWCQCRGVASMPYSRRSRSGPGHMASTMASGWSARR